VPTPLSLTPHRFNEHSAMIWCHLRVRGNARPWISTAGKSHSVLISTLIHRVTVIDDSLRKDRFPLAQRGSRILGDRHFDSTANQYICRWMGSNYIKWHWLKDVIRLAGRAIVRKTWEATHIFQSLSRRFTQFERRWPLASQENISVYSHENH
jgi:hypothetical protein